MKCLILEKSYKMKKLLFIILLLAITQTAFSQATKIMTYNIKCDYTTQGENTWNSRKGEMVELINYYAPDIFGVQEAVPGQMVYLDSCLSNYAYIGVGRDDGNNKGEYSAIFYDSMKFSVHNANTFWLSETPEKVSKGWDAAFERICTYGLFTNKKSNEEFWVFNTHFDHIGMEARKNSVELIIKKTKQLNTLKLPVVIMGDFNLTPETEPIQLMKKEFDDSKDISLKAFYGPIGTFNGFTEQIVKTRIDYFFTRKVQVLSHTHIDDRLKNGKWVSDHLPVLIEITGK